MLKHIAIIAIAGVLAGCSAARQGTTRSEETPAHSLAIHLVDFTPEQPWSPATLGRLADLALVEEPVISGADILSYDFATHSFLVRRSALLRLPDPPVWHKPFVLIADGQRIYLGAFSTMFSSYSSSVPTILVDFRDFTNELTIDQAYPAPGFAAGTDPRSDERVRAALTGLHKLK
jgi:hypothetical protein